VSECMVIGRDLPVYGKHIKDITRKLIKNLGRLQGEYKRRRGSFIRYSLYYERGRVVWYLREREDDWDYYYATLIVFCPKNPRKPRPS